MTIGKSNRDFIYYRKCEIGICWVSKKMHPGIGSDVFVYKIKDFCYNLP